MKIGIYGGSFNPIHKGHVAIAQMAIDKLGLDKLIFVPAYKSPFKSKIEYADAMLRVKMIEMVKPEKSEVSLFEIEREGISYTIDSIKYFKSIYKDDELFFIIGSDNAPKLNMWKQIDEIVELSKIVVFKREVEFDQTNIKKYNCLLLDNEILDYASSWFRKGYMKNIDDTVLEFISSNYLYIPEIMGNVLDTKSLKHSVLTGRIAAKLAKSFGEDPKRAWVAGSLHEITKSWTKEVKNEYLAQFGFDREVNPNELVSKTSYLWLKEEYKMQDELILNSVLKNTSLSENLNSLDKIIFIASKIADEKNLPDVEKIKKLIEKDLDQAFKETLRQYNKKLIDAKKITDLQINNFKVWL